MWIECISFMEHFVSIEMKKKSFEVTKSLSNEDFSDFPSINETTIDFSFTSIILLQPEKHAINEIYSYSGSPKSSQENNKTNDKSVLLGSLT